MARHRRSTPVPVGPAEAGRHRGGRRHHSPVRTGLVASSAALAMGAVAMGAGVIPAPPGAPDGLTAIGDPNNNGVPLPVQPGTSAPDSQSDSTSPVEQPSGQPGGVPAGQEPERKPVPPSRGDDRPAVPPADSAQPTPSPSAPETSAPEETETPPGKKPPKAEEPPKKPSDKPKPPKPGKPAPPSLSDAEEMEAAVLDLVNAEREKAGCDPLKLNNGLAKLARTFSVDMALRGFFAHLNPDGDNPWDRAEAAGIGDLGGENIARGQADAKAVMDAWMSSEGDRANILNCNFKTLGVGVSFGLTGPWWVQNFGL